MIRQEEFRAAKVEAERFLSKVSVAEADCAEREKHGCRSKYLAEAKRASLDLTNALVRFRKRI